MKTEVNFKDRMKAAADNLEAAMGLKELRLQLAMARLARKLIEDAYTGGTARA